MSIILYPKFINGLNDTLRPMVNMLCPTTIEQAAEKARLQELAQEAIYKKHGLPLKSYLKSSSQVCDGPQVAKGVSIKQSEPEQFYNGSKEADTKADKRGQATDEDSHQRKELEAEGKNGSEEADSKSIASLPLVLEKIEES